MKKASLSPTISRVALPPTPEFSFHLLSERPGTFLRSLLYRNIGQICLTSFLIILFAAIKRSAALLTVSNRQEVHKHIQLQLCLPVS